MSAAEKLCADLLDAALSYAAKDLPVFPCKPDSKRPYTSHGFEDATTDPARIREWWARWPNAMIGMPTGSDTGFWALDVDDPEAFERAISFEIPETRRVDTGKGYHLYFKADPANPVTNRQRNAKTGWPFPQLPGAETRGDGGYVIVPPSRHPSGRIYSWHDEASLQHAPKALLSIVTRVARKSPANENARPGTAVSRIGHTRYGQAALDAECDAIREARDGEQEATLNQAALKIGALVAGGEIDRSSAREALIEAGEAMTSFDPRQPWTPDSICAKVDRGLSDGVNNPRSAPERGGVTLDHFRAYMPQHNYIFAPTGELWPATSVNSRIPPVPLKNRRGEPLLDKKGEPVEQKANAWLDENRAVEQMTWAPGLPPVIEDRLVSEGGWREEPGFNVFNLYRPPLVMEGDPAKVGPWIDHLRRVYPDDADHMINWFAHRAQRPEEKINHALVLGGAQGIGKDTILEGPKAAIGPWNFSEVSPQHLLGRFNGFVRSVILRVSEARDLGDVDRFAFYDHMKTYTAAPPDVLRVDEKHLREYAVFNVCGVIITTNHKTDGIYLPVDDRRHYVAWSNLTRESFSEDYWSKLYTWYERGGLGHVAAYLRSLDLSSFNPKAPPPKTPAFWDIVSANATPEDAELADALDVLGWPSATTLAQVASVAPEDFRAYLTDRRNSRRIPHRLEQCGYVPVRNEAARDGLFVVNKKRCAIYAKNTLSIRDQIVAADKLIRR
ncbi:MAG: bifunctional DNA primase/polymerase [Qipengyuania citrea]|uniref:bifunctional DNA primase/polymerase n=1 Tax=Alphaproteobacteria TaxID=28211 RepID=UPI001E48FEAF|nr:bifunctional DNA primase/polymerase [Qipengyuania citrea]MCD1591233.1 bifunctional DNA primase/polymerase [Qipengyuania citrea]